MILSIKQRTQQLLKVFQYLILVIFIIILSQKMPTTEQWPLEVISTLCLFNTKLTYLIPPSMLRSFFLASKHLLISILPLYLVKFFQPNSLPISIFATLRFTLYLSPLFVPLPIYSLSIYLCYQQYSLYSSLHCKQFCIILVVSVIVFDPHTTAVRIHNNFAIQTYIQLFQYYFLQFFNIPPR